MTVPATPGRHPITAGMSPFEAKDEFYYNLRFREKDPRLVPVLTVPMKGEGEQTVAWAVEREDGGRGFGFTGGHFYDNWATDSYRKMALNAILWTAHVDVPEGGRQVGIPRRARGGPGHGRQPVAGVDPDRARRAVPRLAGDEPAPQDRHRADGRMKCRIVTDPEFLAREDLLGYDLIVQNYVNWERPAIGEAARKNLLRYLEAGHGLAVIHFANGAFHPSLPNAKDADWPEYRKIVRRVWDHGKGLSGHDKFGPFHVEITGKHPITDGMAPFDTVDELYYRQQGTEPAEVLVTAKSKDTGKDEPLAWAYQYGKARVFQTVLGHSAESIRADGPATLIRRGAAWAAGFELKPEKPATAPKAVEKRLAFADGKFGKARRPRAAGPRRGRRPLPQAAADGRVLGETVLEDRLQRPRLHRPQDIRPALGDLHLLGEGDFSAYLPGTLRRDPLRRGRLRRQVAPPGDDLRRQGGPAVRGRQERQGAGGRVPRRRPKPRAGPAADGRGLRRRPAHRLRRADRRRAHLDVARPSGGGAEGATGPRRADAGPVALGPGDEGISADTNWTPPTPDVAGEPWEAETDKDWIDGRFQQDGHRAVPERHHSTTQAPKGKVRSYKGDGDQRRGQGRGGGPVRPQPTPVRGRLDRRVT